MQISSAEVSPVSTAASLDAKKQPTDLGESPFSRLLQLASAQDATADNAITQLITGNTSNIHDIVLTAAKADLTFRMVLEIRNRLTEAYQEIMRMQI